MKTLSRATSSVLSTVLLLSPGRGAGVFLQFAYIVIENFLVGLSIFFITTHVFLVEGDNRLAPIVLSVASVRWIIDAALCGQRAAAPLTVYQDMYPYPYALAFAQTQASRFLGWGATVILLQVFAVAANEPFGVTNPVHIVPAIVFQVSVVLAVWSLCLAQAIRYPTFPVYPLIFAILISAILSPTLFLFRDLPMPANVILTSFNPMSHLLAANQNAFWYGHVPSFEVLPVMVLICVGTVVLVWRRDARDGDGAKDIVLLKNWRPRPDTLTVLRLSLLARSSVALRRESVEAATPTLSEPELRATLVENGFESSLELPLSALTDSRLALVSRVLRDALGDTVALDRSIKKLLDDS